MKKVLMILVFIFSNFAYSQADLVIKGFEAYDRGDYPTALKYFQQACDLKNGLGCYSIGAMYANEEGIKRDNFKAVKFYKKACD
ncbi:sel1 repeat family protein, partial [Campylobacter lari]|nr:sel1 repeat family protein [Campylobacter lari]